MVPAALPRACFPLLLPLLFLLLPRLWLRQLSALAVQGFNGKSRVLAWRVARLRSELDKATGCCGTNGVNHAFNSKTFNSFWPLSNILQTIYMMISAKWVLAAKKENTKWSWEDKREEWRLEELGKKGKQGSCVLVYKMISFLSTFWCSNPGREQNKFHIFRQAISNFWRRKL